MINKRLFGSDIPSKVKKKLEVRQHLAEQSRGPNEEITTKYPDPALGSDPHTYSEFVNSHFPEKYIADLSSRTPIARMWTAVSLIDPEVVSNQLAEFDPSDYESEAHEGIKAQNRAGGVSDKELREASKRLALENARKYHLLNEKTKIVEIDGKYYIKEDVREQAKTTFETQVYSISNDNLNDYGLNPNEPVTQQNTQQTKYQKAVEDIFTEEGNTNIYNKPGAGITGISSETEGLLGVIKKTTVKFQVHNFNDFDTIYNRFFLKPGATLFVDFGWSTSDLYDPLDLLNLDNTKTHNDIQTFLFGELNKGDAVEGWISKYQGDIDILHGIVTNYDAKILHNGSVECSVDITSANSALLGFSSDEKIHTKVKNILEHVVLFLAIRPTLLAGTENEEIDDAKNMQIVPNATTSTDDLILFKKNVKRLAIRNLARDDLLPGEQKKRPPGEGGWDAGNTIRTGVFLNEKNISEQYISWGLFEDLVINSQFGYGSDVDEINSGTNLQVRSNSRNSFTFFDESFYHKQRTLSKVPEDNPVILMPMWWGGEDPGATRGSKGGGDYGAQANEVLEGEGSYNYQVEKSPDEIHYVDSAGNQINSDGHTTYDKSEGVKRIPIREVFVRTDVLLGAFEIEGTNVQEVLKTICDKVNTDTSELTKWNIRLGETDSEISVIDTNYLDTQQKIEKHGTQSSNNNQIQKNTEFEELFTFDITSKSSIVTDYDISFNLPEGNIGNMYAIQAMSHDSKIFPLNDMIDNALSLAALDSDNASIVYEPDIGSEKADQLGALTAEDASLVDAYQTAAAIMQTDVYPITATTSATDVIDVNLMNELHIKTDEEDEAIKKANTSKAGVSSADEIIEIEIAKAKRLGYKVMSTYKEYFNLRQKNEILVKRRPTLLPIQLSLTIYGISSIAPGDIFRVNHLPSIYSNNVFFQTMSVKHDISSTGWFTTIDSQFRLRPSEKQIFYEPLDETKILLSPKKLRGLTLAQFPNNHDYYTTNFTGGTGSPSTPYAFDGSFTETGPPEIFKGGSKDVVRENKPLKDLMHRFKDVKVRYDLMQKAKNIDLMFEFTFMQLKPTPTHYGKGSGSPSQPSGDLDLGVDAANEIRMYFPREELVETRKGKFNAEYLNVSRVQYTGYGVTYSSLPKETEFFDTSWNGYGKKFTCHRTAMRFQASEHVRYLLIIQGKWWAIVPHSDDPDNTKKPKNGLRGYDTRDHWNRWGNYDFDCNGTGDAKWRLTMHTPDAYDWMGKLMYSNTTSGVLAWYGRQGTPHDRSQMRTMAGDALVCDETSELNYGLGYKNYGP